MCEKSKILLRLKSLIILIAVTCLSAATANCPSFYIRSAHLTMPTSSYPLRIENRRVVANMPKKDENSLLFIKYDDSLNLLLYDPRAMHFICWNPSKTKLVAKRNPIRRRLKLCSFSEEASENKPLTNYANYYKSKQIIEMSPRGLYASEDEKDRCKKKNFYRKVKKTCGSGDFLLSKCENGLSRFCDVVKNFRKTRGILHDLKKTYCNETTSNNKKRAWYRIGN